MDLALNNLQWLICLKIQPNQTIYDPNTDSFQYLQYHNFLFIIFMYLPKPSSTSRM